ncbi:MAG: AraC family transcriptional regulator [Hyphomicrobiales bacterium]|nr:AraC family transcriptional regulator [Hyphomicrobiales bacterium]
MLKSLGPKAPVFDWISSCATLAQRSGAPFAADHGATRQRILEMSKGRCIFETIEPGRFLRFRGAEARVGRMNVKFLSWEGEGRYETSTWRTHDHHLALHIPLRGSFEARQTGDWVDVAPGSALVVSAAGETRRRWEGPCDLLNIMIDRDALDQSVTREAFAGPDGVLHFPDLTLVDLAEAQTLTRFVEMIVRDLETENSAFSDPAIGIEAERVLLQLLLRTMRHEVERRPIHERYRIVPAYMRRAERLIRERHAEALDVGAIALGSGVSPRTLQYGFRKYRRATPMAFLRDIRLSFARRALIDGRGGSIHAVAASVGYVSDSQFSRDYRASFGESPTETRRTMRG